MYKVADHHGVGVSRAAFLYDESTVILCVVGARDERCVQKFPSCHQELSYSIIVSRAVTSGESYLLLANPPAKHGPLDPAKSVASQVEAKLMKQPRSRAADCRPQINRPQHPRLVNFLVFKPHISF
jgi:hypothetical protein